MSNLRPELKVITRLLDGTIDRADCETIIHAAFRSRLINAFEAQDLAVKHVGKGTIIFPANPPADVRANMEKFETVV